MCCTAWKKCLLLVISCTTVITTSGHAGSTHDTSTNGTIAFERLSSLLEGDVYVINADGTGLKALTDDEKSHQPVWSPDGKHILFIKSSLASNPRYAWEKQSGHPNELYAMNSDGTNPHLLKRLENVIYAAAWSPDGLTLAISYQPVEWVNTAVNSPKPPSGPVPPGLFLMDATGRGEPRLLFRDAWTPAWSPDGKKIAFSQHAGNHWSVHVANSDGSHDAQLTNLSRDATAPAWSPDGKQIAFAALSGNQQTFVMNNDGSHERQLTNDPNWDCQQPSWSPDGKLISVWCMSARGACGAGVGGQMREVRPCHRRIFVISTIDPSARLRQVTDETGIHPQFAPISK